MLSTHNHKLVIIWKMNTQVDVKLKTHLMGLSYLGFFFACTSLAIKYPKVLGTQLQDSCPDRLQAPGLI